MFTDEILSRYASAYRVRFELAQKLYGLVSQPPVCLQLVVADMNNFVRDVEQFLAENKDLAQHIHEATSVFLSLSQSSRVLPATSNLPTVLRSQVLT